MKLSRALNLIPAVLLLFSTGIFSTVAVAQPGTNMPPLLDCGMQGEIEIVCGIRAPEDFEITPDGNYLIIAKFGQGDDAPLGLFNLETQEITALTITDEPTMGWGENSCIESIGYEVNPHGLSLSQRSNGDWQFYVVNHNVRESMEMFELLPDGDSWTLVWRGCVIASEPYNDVSSRPDGSFVATRPQAIQEGANVFGGQPTGNVGTWNAEDGEAVLPGTEHGYPNGVQVSDDGRYAYFSAWTTTSFHKYDLQAQEEVAAVELDFMPDNLTWTPDGKLLAAGIYGVSGNCPEDSNNSCIVRLGIEEINPDTMEAQTIFDSEDLALISGTSVAIETGGYIYVGSFQGDRLVKIPR